MNKSKDAWNAEIYSQFLDLRTRPAKDLLSVIPDSFQPERVYDLGCGPGNSTILLKNRWPHAHVIGLDSSSDMLNEAKKNYPDMEFIQDDIANFSLSKKADCLFANASLQWLDNHEILIPRLLKYLNKNGVLGIQMPNNFHSPSHQVTINLLQTYHPWRSYLKNLRYGILKEPLYKLTWYYDLLIQSGAHSLQIWETEYFQEMNSYHAIFNWVKGTGLRPVLSEMDVKNQTQFSDAYVEAISKEYSLQANNKILLPFKRIFMVCYKG
ncbi:MAG TPA: methyltransferase domain-containing protein [Gammaproteobacteria bacterium]|nr:methyltransferase domain-containing protein [Gammaproteobacteria bacterium]